MVLLEVSEPQKLNYSKSKPEECHESNSCFSDSFGRSIPSSTIHFLGVSARILLNVATKVLLELKES